MDELPGEEDEDAEEEDGTSGSRRDGSAAGWGRAIDGTTGTRTVSSTSDGGVERRVHQGSAASGRAGVASSQRRHSRAKVALSRPAGAVGESASGSEGTSRSLSRSAGGPHADADWLDEQHADGTGHPPRSGGAAAGNGCCRGHL